MWRGRWSCKAGRNRNEVENAVKDDGTKRFVHIFISPVDLQAATVADTPIIIAPQFDGLS